MIGKDHWLSGFKRSIAESLPREEVRGFLRQVNHSANKNKNIEQVKDKFLIFILEDCLVSLSNITFDKEKWPRVIEAANKSTDAIKKAIESIKTGKEKEQVSVVGKEAMAFGYDTSWKCYLFHYTNWQHKDAKKAKMANRASMATGKAGRVAHEIYKSNVWSVHMAIEVYVESCCSSTGNYSRGPYREDCGRKYAKKLIELLSEEDHG